MAKIDYGEEGVGGLKVDIIETTFTALNISCLYNLEINHSYILNFYVIEYHRNVYSPLRAENAVVRDRQIN